MLIPLSGICMQDGLHREWFCTPQNMIKHECMFRSDLCPWIRNMCPSCWHNKLALSCTTSPFVKQFLDIFGPHPHYFCQTQSPPKKHRETRCPVTAVKLLVWVTQLLLVHQSFKRSSLSSAKSHEQRNDLHTKLGGPKLTFQGLLQALPTDNWLYTSLRRIKGPEGVSVLWYAMVLHMCGCCRRDTTTQNAYLVAEHRLCIKCSISAVRIKTEKRQIGFVTLDVDCFLEFATRAGSYSINIIIAYNCDKLLDATSCLDVWLSVQLSTNPSFPTNTRMAWCLASDVVEVLPFAISGVNLKGSKLITLWSSSVHFAACAPTNVTLEAYISDVSTSAKSTTALEEVLAQWFGKTICSIYVVAWESLSQCLTSDALSQQEKDTFGL